MERALLQATLRSTALAALNANRSTLNGANLTAKNDEQYFFTEGVTEKSPEYHGGEQVRAFHIARNYITSFIHSSCKSKRK